MAATRASELLRPGLLDGTCIALARAPGGDALAAAVGEACTALSGTLLEFPLGSSEEVLEQTLRAAGPIDLLALDAAGAFASAAASASSDAGAGAVGRAALADCLQLGWELTRALAGVAFIERERAGRIVLIAPPGDGGDEELGSYARAARAGLENLARTLSIEWSRYSVTTVAITTSAKTPPEELAALCAYLASPAGAYFSGCVLALGGSGD
jgi:NAD(P)-dependent dehydrogenase (short-subunit alcohol dehydrogenase family)